MYVGLKQPRGDGERYVTPARAAAKETTFSADFIISQKSIDDFPKIYSFSFFTTTVEQMRQRSSLRSLAV